MIYLEPMKNFISIWLLTLWPPKYIPHTNTLTSHQYQIPEQQQQKNRNKRIENVTEKELTCYEGQLAKLVKIDTQYASVNKTDIYPTQRKRIAIE